jgi:hypothetical protein
MSSACSACHDDLAAWVDLDALAYVRHLIPLRHVV